VTLWCYVKVKHMARPKDEDLGDDFSYILRMADTDMDGRKPLATALTSVKGVGARTAVQICKNTGFDPYALAGFLDAGQQEQLRLAIESYAETVPLWMLNRQRDLETGNEIHLTGQQVRFTLQDDINRLRTMKCYRGVRHASGNKVRGQRGRSNGRGGLTLGVSRKKA
jgi:small subunit ribosomal protein S13